MYRQEVTIVLRDTDPAGIIYFPRYFSLAQTAFELFLDECGQSVTYALRGDKYLLPVVHAEGDFKIPISFGEKITIHLSVGKIGTRSLTICSEFRKAGGELAAQLQVVHVSVDTRTREPIPLPDELLAVLPATE